MFEKLSPAGSDDAPGILHSLKAAAAALSAILHTALALFATVLEEERERLKQTLILTLLVFFGLSFGFILLTIFVVALFWDQGWIAAIGCLSAVYLGVGVGAALKLKNAFLTRPGLFPATLGELGKDREQLRGSSRE